ncbi:hypothetical protein [Bradyrhizobium sp.]|uniref:hypothetical protein n=1 Tax=Bradyrhizobium sp. TaxID=376 RepID=UPI00261F0A83|nr:hypothetical protein [Bradyrhizobium sp.]
MTRPAILAFAILIAFSQAATAGVPLFGHVSCAMVRFYVARYSAVAAEKWARSHGASDSEIETARHCLHIETASLAAKSQVPAPVTEQERDRHEPAKSDSGQDTLHAVPDQGQHAAPEQVDQATGIQDPIRPKDVENGSSGHVSIAIKELAPADAKTPALPPRHIAAIHRAGVAMGHGSWFKRLWDHLTSRRQFRVAFLHLQGGRR